MTQKSITLVVGLLALVVVGMFWFAYLERSAEQPIVITEPAPEPTVDIPPYLARINAKHYRTDAGHVIAGEVTAPTPCDLVEVAAVTRESFPEQVDLQFSIINNADVCAQVLTTQRFRVDVDASSEAVFTASYMGQPLILNLIPAQPDESPDEFELFIKG